MSLYVLAPDGAVQKYPYSKTDLRRSRTDVSWPKDISDEAAAAFSVYPVTPVAQPSYDPLTQKVTEGTPVEINGVWTQVWNVVALTAEEIAAAQQALQDSIVAATQDRLDTFARTRGYDGILSACTYAASSVPSFAAEGQYCVQQRDATWAALYGILNDVRDGLRPMPTGYADIEPDLPPLAWPA